MEDHQIVSRIAASRVHSEFLSSAGGEGVGEGGGEGAEAGGKSGVGSSSSSTRSAQDWVCSSNSSSTISAQDKDIVKMCRGNLKSLVCVCSGC